jgi:tRNA (cytidine/uridine-2'-O-)-methyltransferase
LVRLALYQPDIPQNAGSLMRLGACLGVGIDVIEPCGFLLTDRNFRRAGMDYLDQVNITRHDSWNAFDAFRRAQSLRLVLFTTRGATPYLQFHFGHQDILMFGRESAGVPDMVHEAADARLVIPMQPGLRSINVAMAVAMAAGEAIRQSAAGAAR